MIAIRHIGIVVKNYQESLDFYLLLGFIKRISRVEPTLFINRISAGHNINLSTTRLTAPNEDMIELLDYGKTAVSETKHNSLFGNGIAHFAITVKDIGILYNKMIGKGIKFLSSPEISPDGYAKVVFCQAPEGTFIELVEVL